MPSILDDRNIRQKAKALSLLADMLDQRGRVALRDTNLNLDEAESFDKDGYIDLVYEENQPQIWEIHPSGLMLANSWRFRKRNLPMRIILKIWSILPALVWRIVESVLAFVIGYFFGRYIRP
jgi:hypothetical protein